MMKTKKLSLIGGVSVCVLIVLLTWAYALLSNASASVEKIILPCDVEDSHAKEAIEWAVENGFMKIETVDGASYFFPKSEVKKGEIAKVFVTYFDIDVKKYEDTEIGFADESQISEELLPYVRAAVSNGYIKLFSDYTYRADSLVSREEIADIFAPHCKISVSAGKSEKFSDFDDVSLYFKDNVKKIVDLEIMVGYSDGTFRPKNIITREELAMVLYRFAQLE